MMPSKSNSVKENGVFKDVLTAIGIAGLFFGLTLVATFPLVFHLKDAIAGSGDGFAFIWQLWWFKHALLDLRQNPFFTTYQFFPYGADITYDVSLVYGTLGLPLVFCCGSLVAFNVLMLLTFIGTGVGSFVLLNQVCQDKRVALIGSVYFTFSYQRMLRVFKGQLDIASTQWSALYLLFLLRILSEEDGKKRNIIFASLFFSVMGYTDYRLLVTMSLVTVVVAIYVIIRRATTHRSVRETTKALLVFVLVSGLFLSPLLLLNITRITDRVDPQKAMVYTEEFSTKPAELLRLPINASLRRLFDPRSAEGKGSGNYIGWTAALFLLLTPIAYRKANKHRREHMLFWSFLALFFFTLSLGPGEEGSRSSRLLPYHLLMGKPIVSFLRVPTRFFIVTQLALSALMSYSVLLILKAFPMRKRTKVSLLVGSLVFLESLLVPVQLVSPSVPTQYARIGKIKGDFTILEFPLKINDGYQGITSSAGRVDGWQLYSATVHQKPTVNGYITRLDENTWSALRLDPFIKKLKQCQDEKICQEFTADDRRYLEETLKSKYLTLFDPSKYNHLKSFIESNLPLRKISQTNDYIFYRILLEKRRSVTQEAE